MEDRQQRTTAGQESAINAVTEPITKDRILRGLPTHVFGHTLYFFKEIDSTNSCAKTLADAGAESGTVVWAEYQSAGRGRLGRTWRADPGLNLMFSVILRESSRSRLPWTPYYISEAVAGGIERTIDLHVQAKWPNDLLLEGKKLCGMLLEGNDDTRRPYVVSGIGINVNQSAFPPDLESGATSLKLACGSDTDRILLFHNILENMEALFGQIDSHGDSDVLEAWKSRCTTFGSHVSVRTGTETITGLALGLSKDGGLLVETSQGIRTVHAGDVALADELSTLPGS